MSGHNINGRLKALIPLVVILIALVGFVMTSSWQQQRDFKVMREEMEKSRKELAGQIAAQGEQLTMREVSVRALSKDLLDQNKKLRELAKLVDEEKKVNKKERLEGKKKVKELVQKLSDQKKQADTDQEKVQSLEELLEKMEARQVKVEQGVQDLQASASKHEEQILMIREEFLVRKDVEVNALDVPFSQTTSSINVLPPEPEDFSQDSNFR